jgi:fused signal recognition particle receptor
MPPVPVPTPPEPPAVVVDPAAPLFDVVETVLEPPPAALVLVVPLVPPPVVPTPTELDAEPSPPPVLPDAPVVGPVPVFCAVSVEHEACSATPTTANDTKCRAKPTSRLPPFRMFDPRALDPEKGAMHPSPRQCN